MKKSVTIIITSSNALFYTKHCLKSIKKYTNFPHEIIVVDNGSKDGTLEYLSRFDWIRLIINEENLYAAKAACQGLGASMDSNSAYIMFLDSDTIVLKRGWLKDMVSHLESDEQIGAIGPKYGVLFYNDGYPTGVEKLKEYVLKKQWLENLIGTNEISSSELLSMLTLKRPGGIKLPPGIKFPRGPSFNELCGWCQLYRREVINKIGFPAWEVFKERNAMFWDSEFSMRVLPLGYRLENSPLVNGPEAKVHHFGQRSNMNAKQYAKTIEEDKKFIQSVLRD